jgi:hypothetical protein
VGEQREEGDRKESEMKEESGRKEDWGAGMWESAKGEINYSLNFFLKSTRN